jgi:RNA polymerase sigma-70 factor (ECF subfamily)
MDDPSRPAEADLVRRAATGDLDAFNRIVDVYQDGVYALCVRILGDRHTAEDATQETFISAYRAISRFEGANLKAWLYRIAVNQCRDELRRRRRKGQAVSIDVPFEDDEESRLDVPDASAGAPEILEQRELGAALNALLLMLPVEQREVVVLVDVHGYPYEEVAAMTGTSIGTVKSRIFRGREKLRALISARPELFPARPRQDR